MNKPLGVLGKDYHDARRSKRSHRYRLARRSQEVCDAITRHFPAGPHAILDLGTADGIMLNDLKMHFAPDQAVGLEYSCDLLACADRSQGCQFICGDAMWVPLRDESFDAIVATAVIEHVACPRRMLDECRRLLRPGGIMVLTTPEPLMEHVASMVGLLKEDHHNEVLNLERLSTYAKQASLSVLEARKFMFSPIGFPMERTIERVLGPVGLNLVMANQLLVARRD
jgi:ubiquinone/menaquinone biosynthesis C-methylase UbiE